MLLSYAVRFQIRVMVKLQFRARNHASIVILGLGSVEGGSLGLGLGLGLPVYQGWVLWVHDMFMTWRKASHFDSKQQALA